MGKSALRKYWPLIGTTALTLSALLATAALLGTFSFSSGPGPLGQGGSGGQVCAPSRAGHWATMAAAVENDSGSPVVIRDVRLPTDARNMRMTKAWI
ncbi:MAG: hypothetical protein J2P29_03780, partial [Actinobacteria bacterium]|nr:hypothetical protein [Actinomycetota bacterium]